MKAMLTAFVLIAVIAVGANYIFTETDLFDEAIERANLPFDTRPGEGDAVRLD